MKKPSNMTDAEWAAYRARVARRKADPDYQRRVQKRLVEADPAIFAQVGAMAVEIENGVDNKFGTPDDVVDITPLTSLSKNKLLKMARQKGLEVTSKMTKEELLDILR